MIFAERVATLKWLREHLQADLKLTGKQAVVLHGGLTDVEQQEIVGDFKKASSPVRVLITGDLASEGVNLHAQCNQLVHYDIPWSLIRIEQRNGRIDRYGQRKPPQITTLLLSPATEAFSGATAAYVVLSIIVRALGSPDRLVGGRDPHLDRALRRPDPPGRRRTRPWSARRAGPQGTRGAAADRAWPVQR